MENKLQELTRKLYDEGLEKGRAEADRVLAEAKTQAAKTVADAQAEAAAIVREAERKAEETRKNSLTEIALAGREALSRIKEEIVSLVVTKATADKVASVNLDASFIREVLVAVAANWNGASSSKVELQALLPEAQRAKLDAAVRQEAKALLDAGVEVGWSKEVRTGFRVGAKNGGYYISFSDDDFNALLGEYLREKVADLLFKA